MVYNCFIKCQVCDSITRVRLQVSYQKEHPIVVTCGKCGISLSGNVTIGQDRPSLKFEFDNAEVLNGDEKANYVVECSGEFPTNKQCNEDNPNAIPITPFIRSMTRMRSNNDYEEFGKAVSELNNTATQWKNYKRVLDLFQNKNKSYLIKEINKIFPESAFPCRNEFEILRAVHMIEVHGFISPLRKDIIDDLTISSGILKFDNNQLMKLIDFLRKPAILFSPINS